MALALAATEFGDGPPVAILHGLFGAGRNWTGIARRLAARYRSIVFDLRNHGASPWADTMSYPEMAEDVDAAMRARGHRRYRLLGHSMGGKVAMAVALADASAVERLVAVDIAPVAYEIPFRSYVEAMRRLDLAAVARRGDADAALAAAVPDAAERGFLLQNLVLGDGSPRWQLNLAALEAAMSVIAGFPSLPQGATFDGPALFVAGGRSPYLKAAHEGAIRALFPHAAVARIEDAGHWVHIERPHEFLALVERFFEG
ncbi:MAG TPA: alpha/beta fold hydrolase [Stellaceae bacterium]|nr:alpha/beta fold hydrolase [Stellaceae bacterium]